MRAFEYASPKQKQQAVGLLGPQWDNAEVLAGGTDLLALMKDDIVHPRRLVNIKDLQELHGISLRPQTGLRIGALTTLVELAEDATVKQNYPMLAAAASEAASPQIRNVATIWGNMCQRPRCWYFRNGFGLLPKDQSGKSLVLEGDNRLFRVPSPAFLPVAVLPVQVKRNLVVQHVAEAHQERDASNREERQVPDISLLHPLAKTVLQGLA